MALLFIVAGDLYDLVLFLAPAVITAVIAFAVARAGFASLFLVAGQFAHFHTRSSAKSLAFRPGRSWFRRPQPLRGALKKGALEVGIVKVDAHACTLVGAVDELAVANVDAGMVATAGMPEGHNVPCAHFVHIVDALADDGLFTCSAGQLHANAFIRPAHKTRTVETVRGRSSAHIRRADG